MKFLVYIFYRYYSYLFNKNSVGDDLLKAQFFITFFIFLILFTIMLIAEINIMVKAIKKGPEAIKGE